MTCGKSVASEEQDSIRLLPMCFLCMCMMSHFEHHQLLHYSADMKAALCGLLLVLLWSLVEVHSQPAPYLTFMDETLPDHSYVDLSALGDIDNVDDHVVCHTDLTSCCGGMNIDDRGYWFFPNGTELPGVAGGPGAATNPIVLMRDIQLVRLIRGTGSGDVPSGLYSCIIETVAENDPGSPSPGNGIGETLYVGVYSTGGMYSTHN